MMARSRTTTALAQEKPAQHLIEVSVDSEDAAVNSWHCFLPLVPQGLVTSSISTGQ